MEQQIQPSVMQAGTNMLRDSFLAVGDGVSMIRRFFGAGDRVAAIAEVNANSWHDVAVDRAKFKQVMGRRQLDAQLKELDMSLEDLRAIDTKE